MSTDGWKDAVEAVRVRWRTLERDWQSVVVGTTIVVVIAAFGVQVPW